MSLFLKKFFSEDEEIHIHEFGHSCPETGKTVGPWSRELYLLHFVKKGSCEFQGFRAEAGQAFLIAKGLRHSFMVSENYEHYWIGFSGDGVKPLLQRFGIADGSHQLFFVEHPAFAEALFCDALNRLRDGELHRPQALVAAVMTAMLPLLKREVTSETRRETNYAELAQRYIQANYADPIRMNDIARQMHISEKHMYRLFVKRFGCSPQRFLLRTRMEAAKALLSEKVLTVKEVALSVGYTSLPSFSGAFSSYFGMSPGTVKKKNSDKKQQVV